MLCRGGPTGAQMTRARTKPVGYGLYQTTPRLCRSPCYMGFASSCRLNHGDTPHPRGTPTEQQRLELRDEARVNGPLCIAYSRWPFS